MRATGRRGSWLLSRSASLQSGHGCVHVLASPFRSRGSGDVGGPDGEGGSSGRPQGERQKQGFPSGMFGGPERDVKSCGSMSSVELLREDVGSNFSGLPRVETAATRGIGQMTDRDVTRLCEEGQVEEALETLRAMMDQGIGVHVRTYESLIQTCIERKALRQGVEVHAHIMRSGLESEWYLAGNIVRMYAGLGRLVEAQAVFDRMQSHNSYAWTALIRGYVEAGKNEEALKLFPQMLAEKVKPSPFVLTFLLRACVSVEDLEQGRKVHACIRRHGLESDTFMGTAVLDMYAKLGSHEDARRVFEKMPTRNVVSWTAMLVAYTTADLPMEAIRFYKKLREAHVKPDGWIFSSVLKACGNLRALEEGRRVHADIIDAGLELDVIVGTALVDMYAKGGDIHQARHVFDGLRRRNAVSWTALITGYTQVGQAREVIKLYKLMQQAGVKPNTSTFTSVLKACASIPALEEGRSVHADVILNGFELEVTMGNSLIDLYANCGSMPDALEVFEKMPTRNVVSWTAMLVGYTQAGLAQDAIRFYKRMHDSEEEPDDVAYACILKACASVRAVEEGREVHKHILASGFSNLVVGNALVYMYARCGSLDEALEVCEKMPNRNAVTWYGVIAGFSHYGRAEEAIKIYWRMKEEGVEPSTRVFTRVLHACAQASALKEGRKVHTEILRKGLTSDVFVGSALVHMYSKCGSIEDARQSFDALPTKNVVVWTAMIGACFKHGLAEEGAKLFEQMQREGVKPDLKSMDCMQHAMVEDLEPTELDSAPD